MSFARMNKQYKSIFGIIVVLATILASAVSPNAARAAAICYVDAGSTSPTPDGLSWATAFASLQDAIASSECSAQIWVANGTYTPSTDEAVSFAVKPGVVFYGGFDGNETDLEDRVLHLDDAIWTNDAVLSGEIGLETKTDNTQHVLSLGGSTNPATRMDGFVVTGGYADEPTSNEGGGLILANSVLHLSNMVFRDNFAGNKGAAISSAYGQITFEDTIFELNMATDGGAIYEHQSANTYDHVTFRQNQASSGGGVFLYASNSTFTDSTFTGNSTLSGDGGAIMLNSSSPTFTDVVIDANFAQGSSASRGGGMAVTSGSAPTLTRVTISNNLSNSDGGGVFNAGPAEYNQVTFTGNMAGLLDVNGNPTNPGVGGGMFMTGSNPLVRNSLFLRNRASTMGGGLANYFGSSAMIANVIFNANEAVGGGGGGLVITGPHASPTIVNSTFVNNNTINGYGGGLFAYGGGPEATITVANSILWDNTRGAGSLSQVQVDPPSQLNLSYSDVEAGYTGTGNVNTEPGFVNILGGDGNWGTVDDDLRLLWSSPLIDAGSNTAVSASITQDYAGQSRFADLLSSADTGEGTTPIVDMGVYELQAPNLQVSKAASPVTAPEGAEVTYTIAVTNSGAGSASNVTLSDPLPANLQPESTPVISPSGSGTAGVAPILFEGISLDSGESITVTYTAAGIDGPGTVDNTVTVTANEVPAPGVTDAASLTLTNAAPTVNAGADVIINEGATAFFTGNFVDPAGTGDAPYTYLWTFSGTSETASTLSASRSYADQGDFTATLSVTDAEGAAGSDPLNIHVNNVAPTVNAGGDATINEGDSVAFSPTVSDPGADTLTYAWDFDDGTTSSQTNPTHIFADNDMYHVTLTVNDGDGGSTTDEVVVTVNNVAPQNVNAGADREADEGDTLSFTGSATDPAGLSDPLTYSWNFGEGPTNYPGQSVNHTYADNGIFTVTLTVTDGDGGNASDTLQVMVSNLPPVNVNAGVDRFADEGQLLSFTGSATDPGSGDTLIFSWNFGDSPATFTGQTVSHTYADDGIYTVTLTVSDGDGGSDSDSLTVTVANVAPTVNAGSYGPINEGGSVSFSPTVSDPGTDTLTYAWDFGDGATSSLPNPTHIFADNDTYHVTLTVSDGEGGSTTDEVVVTVNNVSPQNVNAGADRDAEEGDLLSFAGSATDPAGVNDPLIYSWNFGDSPTNYPGQSVNHTYADNGNFTVTLTVNDGDGGTGTDTQIVRVSNVAPTVDLGTDRTVNEGSPVNFSATVSDPGTDNLIYAWDFDDGTTSNVAGPTHTFADNDVYHVTLTVSDGDGGSTTDEVVVTVNNVAPQNVNAGADRDASEGELVSFTGSATDPGAASDPLTYSWNFGDGPTNYPGQSVNHTYAENGNYTVTLTVSDGDGGTDTGTLLVRVSNVPPQNVSAGADRNADEGALLSFTGSATDPAGANDPLTYTWSFGDSLATFTGQTVSHAYGDNGVYIVTLTVSDGDGGESSDTATITVSNVAPLAVNAGPDFTTDEGTSIDFFAAFTDPGSLDTHTIRWDFGDSSGASGVSQHASHAYADEGVYTVTLTVEDDDGGSLSDTVIVTVNNVAPSVNAGSNVFTNPGATVNFNGEFHELPGVSDQPYTITWDFGDGETASGLLNPSHIFNLPGRYTVTLSVQDGDGAIGTDTLTVDVSDFVIFLPFVN